MKSKLERAQRDEGGGRKRGEEEGGRRGEGGGRMIRG